jgi:hypothetical protein
VLQGTERAAPVAAFLAFGTRGDVEPVLAVARGWLRVHPCGSVVFITHAELLLGLQATGAEAGAAAITFVGLISGCFLRPVTAADVIGERGGTDDSSGTEEEDAEEVAARGERGVGIPGASERRRAAERTEALAACVACAPDLIAFNLFAMVGW